MRREIDFARLDYREWREIVSVILDGAYPCRHAALPHLVAARAGVAGLTRALAHDLAPHRVTVNCVVPGYIDTQRADGVPARHASVRPLAGRLGKPEEIAAVVRVRCGPDARYITGQSIHAKGGVFMA